MMQLLPQVTRFWCFVAVEGHCLVGEYWWMLVICRRMLVRSSYIHNWGRLDKSNFTVRIWCFGTESSSFVQVNRQHLVHCSYMTLSPHHHFISTKSLVRSLSAIPDKCAIVCWYPRLLGTIPLLLDVVVNAHVCCVLRKISNIMKKNLMLSDKFPFLPR